LLAPTRNGRWLIEPAGKCLKISRRYWDNTLILETRFETANGVVALIDFMPPRGNASDVVRLVRGITGKVKLQMQLVIPFGFGIDIPWVQANRGWRFAGDFRVGTDGVANAGETAAKIDPRWPVSKSAKARPSFVLTYGPSHLPLPKPINPAQALQDGKSSGSTGAAIAPTTASTRSGMRSLITLKAADLWADPAALSRRLQPRCGKARGGETGITLLLAARPTFTLLALMNSGYTEEALAWHNWLLRATAGWPSNMQSCTASWASGGY